MFDDSGIILSRVSFSADLAIGMQVSFTNDGV